MDEKDKRKPDSSDREKRALRRETCEDKKLPVECNEPDKPEVVMDEAELTAADLTVAESLRMEGSRLNAVSAGIAEEKIVSAIRRGLEQGKARSKPRRRWRAGLSAGAVIACFVLLFAFTVRVSPVFANAMRDIPGIGAFVKLVEYDSALRTAIDKDFMQLIGKTVEKDGIQLTVEGLIADERRLVVFYSSNITKGWGDTGISFSFYDEENKRLEGTLMFDYSSMGKTANEPRAPQDMVDLQLLNTVTMPKQVKMKAEVDDTVLEVEFPIDHSRFEGLSQEMAIGKTVEIDGQKVTFETAKLSPLQLEVVVRNDSANSSQVKGFIHMVIEDERGEPWRWTNAYGLPEGGRVYHFESSYFNRPKQLTIKADGIFTVPKQAKLVIDTEKASVLEAPDSRVSFEGINEKADYMLLTLAINQLDEVDQLNAAYNLVGSTFIDGAGKKHELASPDYFTSGSFNSNENKKYVYVPLPKGDYPQPLTFDVEDYPGYALQPFQIEINP
ncbi:DUF4179 domain-containing protein [Paenibacillus spongiae]|uniref:DUF4179 domain-containing protein n=1 Tax=Paenibacillus spongiae TaxID=2909671 RepID=A0ABY5SCU9_9BACL|nr:DUF4179 domain-containing protein [Paenibacillus spongiae]UVI30565.1 DUF4179 domain-containing protein [Paenibacillus spongiae]